MTQVIPLTYYTRNVPMAIETTSVAPYTTRTMDTSVYKNYDIFHRNFVPSKILSHVHNYIHHHKKPSAVHDSEKQHKYSWLYFLNPFECENEYNDKELEEIDDDDGEEFEYYDDSSEFSRRKFLSLLKLKKLKKLKKLMKLKALKEKLKKKKKKKFVLLKILFGILVFFAVKALLEKLYYYYPTLVAYAGGRDELYHEGEHVLDRNVDFKDVGDGNDVNNSVEHRSFVTQSLRRRTLI
ncbi:hypothetical protein PVAND_000102 [Polypedilum vanderplanki]|uniref:Uncharacterized protein n=1 Tax=Polypedilum vanderplanki TaxID=319348 RepID=A0A9J6BIT6_POLVA|nr:hypothetical protein PVAND_000102 [Polypedilum vanderplanki]